MGRLIEGPEDFTGLQPFLAVNTFRHDLAKATSSQPIWHYLVLVASCLFFFDVFVRRVQVGFGWVPALSRRVRDAVFGRKEEVVQVEVIERLRSRKAEVGDRVEQLRATARFEPSPEAPAKIQTVQPLEAPPTTPRTPEQPSLVPESKEESYTERLLRAKQQAWKREGKDEG